MAMTLFRGLYHLVGCNQQVPRDREAERPRDFEIDDQFEFPVLPDGEFRRVLAPRMRAVPPKLPKRGGFSPLREI
jgi:hypothetical protein